MRALWLPEALQDYGVEVTLTAGWETRGRDAHWLNPFSATFRPQGCTFHHTAGGPGECPSLGVCINGRPDVPGPLCHGLVGRSGRVYLIASGIANHAGAGGWLGLTSNKQVLGFEFEHSGYIAGPKAEAWTDHIMDVAVRIGAAVADGAGFDVKMLHAHYEWAPQRKVDPRGWAMPGIRFGSAIHIMGHHAPAPAPPAPSWPIFWEDSPMLQARVEMVRTDGGFGTFYAGWWDAQAALGRPPTALVSAVLEGPVNPDQNGWGAGIPGLGDLALGYDAATGRVWVTGRAIGSAPDRVAALVTVQ